MPHKNNNYDMVPYIVSSFPSSSKVSLFAPLLLQESDQQLGKSDRTLYQDIKVQVTTKDIQKGNRLCMKSPPGGIQYYVLTK